MINLVPGPPYTNRECSTFVQLIAVVDDAELTRGVARELLRNLERAVRCGATFALALKS